MWLVVAGKLREDFGCKKGEGALPTRREEVVGVAEMVTVDEITLDAFCHQAISPRRTS